MICLTPKLNQGFFGIRTQIKEKCFAEKEFLRKRESGRLNKKRIESLLTVLAMPFKKDLRTSIRKNANELKVHEKNVRTEIKQDLSPAVNPFNNVILGVLENKINV